MQQLMKGFAMTERKFTAGEVAGMIGVSRSTINRWIKSGKLNAYSVYGGGSRISEKDLYEFIRKYNISCDPGSKGDEIRILVVDDDFTVRTVLYTVLNRNPLYDIRVSDNWFDTGFIIHEFKPHILVMDILLKDIDTREVLQVLRNWPECFQTKIIGISGKIDTREEEMLEKGFDAYFQKPVDLRELEKKIGELLPDYLIES